jgi:transcriptional regulator with XRE-family HTH domain
MPTLQHRLAEVLRRKKVSKRQLSIRLGIKYGNVFRYFSPSYDPKLSMLKAWAKALGCRVRDLYDE